MTEPNEHRRIVRLGGAGLAIAAGLALTCFALNPGEPTDDAGAARAQLPEHDARGQWAEVEHYGAIPSLPVDPASPDYEGKESDDWDTLSSAERIERSEREVQAQLGAIESTHDPNHREQLRARALSELSAARSDFFASEAGAARYLELERSLEG